MQAVVLCGGRGVRLRPLTDLVPKVMVPVAGRPLVEYIVEKLEGLGLDIIMVVGYLKEAVMDYFRGRAKFCVQEEPLGTAHALLAAEALVESERLVVVNGDLFFTDDLRWVVEEEPAIVSVYWVEDASRYGAVEVDGDRVVGVIEKGRAGPGFVNAGIYLFDRSIFRLLRGVEPSPRGEYELTDAIKKLVEGGSRVRARRLSGFWADVGRPEDLARVEEYVRGLERLKAQPHTPTEVPA
ncbi:MAG: sugar phosphate nucleotidyltransferase [Candidatus Nezhaarchaeales archaeon]